MRSQMATALYVVLMAAVIVAVDVLFFKRNSCPPSPARRQQAFREHDINRLRQAGFQIVDSLDIVRGAVVRSRWLFWPMR